jgi:hypothetical protein
MFQIKKNIFMRMLVTKKGHERKCRQKRNMGKKGRDRERKNESLICESKAKEEKLRNVVAG